MMQIHDQRPQRVPNECILSCQFRPSQTCQHIMIRRHMTTGHNRLEKSCPKLPKTCHLVSYLSFVL